MQVQCPNFAKRGGIVPVVVQDWMTLRVLMLAYTDEAGWKETLATGEAIFYSTSRKERWKKGEMSGHIQIVHEVLVDCDGDALVFVVEARGPACHTGMGSCFFRSCTRKKPAISCGQPESLSPSEILNIEGLPVHERLSQQISLACECPPYH